MLILEIVFAAVGLLIAALGVPLMRRRVKRNGWYGLRTPATLQSKRVWYEANAKSGRDMVVLGLLLFALAVLLPAFPGMSAAAYENLVIGLLLGGTLLACAVGWRRANRLRDAERASSAPTPPPPP